MAGPIPETALVKQIIKRQVNYNGKEKLKVLWEYYPGKPTGYVSFEARENLVTWGKAAKILGKFDREFPLYKVDPEAKSHPMRTRFDRRGSTSYVITPGK